LIKRIEFYRYVRDAEVISTYVNRKVETMETIGDVPEEVRLRHTAAAVADIHRQGRGCDSGTTDMTTTGGYR